MSNRKLWAVSTKGNVYTLSTNDHTWRRIENEGQCLRGFKKVSATPQGAWGLGCDHLVYVHVTECDVPIRVQLSTNENERWILSRGWGGDNLLPHLDPWVWSNEDGSVHLPKEDFRLPQFWRWENDWMVDENVKGHLTDKGGWRYSNLDFHHDFSHKKTFKSCVRRRRWIRYKRYHATNRWARLPSIHVDPLEEPIMDLSVGGHQIPNQQAGFLGVWIVTINGRVLYRVGVSGQCPEGQSWKEVPVGDDQEVLNISMGPTGLLWAVTWSGKVIVRTGVSWYNPMGTGWKEVELPALEGRDRLCHCSVGVNAVWVSSIDGKIWLRKGVASGSGDISESSACGSGWLQMINTMKMLSVGPQDRVWGIDSEDFHIYFRSGISYEETSGKSWKIMDLPYEYIQKSSISICSESSTITSDIDIQAEEVPPTMDTESKGSDHDTGYQSSDVVSEDAAVASMTDTKIPESTAAATASGTTNIKNRGIFGKLSQKFKTASPVSKFYVDLTENETFKKNEKVIHNVVGHLEKNLTRGIEDGVSIGKRFGRNLEKKLEKNIPAVKQVTRRNDPDVSFQYSKDEKVDEDSSEKDVKSVDGEIKVEEEEGSVKLRPKGRVSMQLRDSSGSVVSGSSRDSDRFSLNRNELESLTGSNQDVSSQGVDDKGDGGEKKCSSSGAVETVVTDVEGTCPRMHLDGCDDAVEAKEDVVKEGGIVDGGDGQAVVNDDSGTVAESAGDPTQHTVVSKEDVDHKTGTSSSSASDVAKKISSLDLREQSPEPDEDGSIAGSDLAVEEVREFEYDESWIKYETEPDEGEIQWIWMSASVAEVTEESCIRQWFVKEADQVDSLVSRYRVSQAGWRNLVLMELRNRNKVQMERFSHYKLAVEKGVWSKKGQLRWWQDLHRGHKWVDCNVELTQDSDGPSKFAAFTLHYQIKGEFKFLQVELSDMSCVHSITDKSMPSVFVIHTEKRLSDSPRQAPLKLAAQTEEEMEDWLAALSIGCCDQRSVGNNAPAEASVWAVTNRGDIFVHEPDPNLGSELGPNMFWHQLGGHLKAVESNICGVTWGIGDNGTAWVYTGGYGGGFFKGMATSRQGMHVMSDVQEHFVYENQRWRLLRGYTDRVLMADHYMWSDESGKKEATKDGTKLPSVHWSWHSDWAVDRRTPGGVDKDGWQYARAITGPFSSQPRFRSNLRRRRWCRRSKIVTSGPWSEVGPLPLRSVTVQLDGDALQDDAPVAVWAAAANGDVLCRLGVTKKQPRGIAWHHVSTDVGCVSITHGERHQVWAIAEDGSAWLRNSITDKNPTELETTKLIYGGDSSVREDGGGRGCEVRADSTYTIPEHKTCKNCWHSKGNNWSQISPPDNSFLVQIAAGDHYVMAVDQNNMLWLRQGITGVQPEGTSWVQVCKNVQQVSIGPRDQVWVILDGVSSKNGTLNGVVSRRVGISHDKPKVGAWDHGIGGDWSYVCARAWIK